MLERPLAGWPNRTRELTLGLAHVDEGNGGALANASQSAIKGVPLEAKIGAHEAITARLGSTEICLAMTGKDDQASKTLQCAPAGRETPH